MNGKNDEYIKIATSIPSLKNKVHVNIANPNDKIYWYIKFNLALDKESVSKKTMNVTEVNGYILDTDISYNELEHLIVINPLEEYVQNEYYLLNISKKVCSANKQRLKNDIHILFKLKGNIISEFKILPKGTKVPKPKKKPKQVQTNSKVYSFDRFSDSEERSNSLPFADIMINPAIGAAGLVMTIASLLMGNIIVISGCLAVVFIGLGHIILQLSKSNFRSNFFYNRGVKKFNNEKFEDAEKFFVKALNINPENEYAEYAKNKLSYFKEHENSE